MSLDYDFILDPVETVPPVGAHGTSPYVGTDLTSKRRRWHALSSAIECTAPVTATSASASEFFAATGDFRACVEPQASPLAFTQIIGAVPVMCTRAVGSFDEAATYTRVIGAFHGLSHDSSTSTSFTSPTIVQRFDNTLGLVASPEIASDPLVGYDAYARPNWDAYGADPVEPATLAAARQFLRMLPAIFGKPDIAPGSDGTIALEWILANRPLRKLFIDIGPNLRWSGYWRRANGAKGTVGPFDINATTRDALRRLFNDLNK